MYFTWFKYKAKKLDSQYKEFLKIHKIIHYIVEFLNVIVLKKTIIFKIKTFHVKLVEN